MSVPAARSHGLRLRRVLVGPSRGRCWNPRTAGGPNGSVTRARRRYVVRMGRQEDRGPDSVADLLGRVDPVGLRAGCPSAQVGATQRRLASSPNGVKPTTVARSGHWFWMSRATVVLDKRVSSRCHRPRSRGVRVKEIVKVVPPSRLTMMLPWSCCVRSSTAEGPASWRVLIIRSGGSPTPLSRTTRACPSPRGWSSTHPSCRRLEGVLQTFR